MTHYISQQFAWQESENEYYVHADGKKGVICSNVAASKYGRNCALTSFVHADFSDAKLFGRRVHTLNDDVLVHHAGRGTIDVDHFTDGHSDSQRATDRVRHHFDCGISSWQGV